jgi:tryptophanyl-tRNA synthetase
MRPTGPLHLGHYFGALSNWVRMQEQYDCFFFVADWHALTTHYADDTRLVPHNTLEIALDWLSVGLDPAKCTLFLQSLVPEHAELHLLLSMITPLDWLERVPTYREQIAQLKERDLGTYGFLGYPLLQTADIAIYGADFVPVGEDQVPHVELAREVVRRFNFLFGFEIKRELFANANILNRVLAAVRLSLENPQMPEGTVAMVGYLPPDAMSPTPPGGRVTGRGETGGPPSVEITTPSAELTDFIYRLVRQQIKSRAVEVGYQNFLDKVGEDGGFFRWEDVLHEPAAMLTETPRFPGTDGRRMAKSYGNAIWLRDDPETIRRKVAAMMTDPQRVRRTDPGRPEICPVFAYHLLFSAPDVIHWSEQGCRAAAIGCVECKRAMAESLVRWIAPVQQRRHAFEADPGRVRKILAEGSARARKVARHTMARVRQAVFGRGFARAERATPEQVRSEGDS